MSQHLFQAAQAHPNPRHNIPLQFSEDSPLSLPPPASTRGHQRSRTATDLPPLFSRTKSSSPTRSSAFLPFLRPQSTRSLSPERVSATEAAKYEVPQTPPEDDDKRRKPTTAADKLASWFEGSSDPVNISLVPSPRKEQSDPIAEAGTMENLFSASQDSLDTFTRRPRRKPSITTPAPSGMSRFNLFRKSPVSPTPGAAMDDDELSYLDVREALFPHGYPEEFSPATFKNLQMNAEGILRRFQQAHVEQRQTLKSLSSTKISQADELEAANTRNEHLKFQLEDMAEKAADQERAIAQLRAQLTAQRSTLNSQLPQQQSVRMVQDNDQQEELASTTRSNYRRHRVSDISTSSGSDSGSDASDASSVVSVFSEAMSIAPSHMTSIPSPILKTINPSYPAQGCSKCHGLSATEAWDVVGMMKMESSGLKQRISELENAQSDALDFLTGLKLD